MGTGNSEKGECPEKTGKKLVCKLSSNGTLNGNSCSGINSTGSSTPSTPAYASSNQRSCGSSGRFRRSSSKGDIRSGHPSTNDLYDLSTRLESTDGSSGGSSRRLTVCSAGVTPRYDSSESAGVLHGAEDMGLPIDDDDNSPPMQESDMTSSISSLTQMQYVAYPGPTIAYPPDDRTLAVIIETDEEEYNCGGGKGTDCGDMKYHFRRYLELYPNMNTGCCGSGSASCADAGGFGPVMGPTADNFLRLFPQEKRQRYHLHELSLNILQLPQQQVVQSIYDGEANSDEPETPGNVSSNIPVNANITAPQSRHFMQFVDASSNIDFRITGGSELRWMQFVEPHEKTNQQQERLVLESNDGDFVYDADFGFKLKLDTLSQYHENNTLYYLRSPPSANPPMIYVIRKHRYLQDNIIPTDSFISPNYEINPFLINNPSHLKFRYYFCENDNLYCYGIVSTTEIKLKCIRNVLVYDGIDAIDYGKSISGYSHGNGLFQRDILEMTSLHNGTVRYIDIYREIALHKYGEFLQQNSLGEVYRGYRYCKIYPTSQQQSEVVKVSCKIDSICLVMKLIHHYDNISSYRKDANITVQEAEESLKQHLMIRNENFAQELRAMSFLSLITNKSMTMTMMNSAAIPVYRHSILDLIPDLDIEYHNNYETISTFHRHHILTRAHGKFLLFASDYYPERCLTTFVNKYRKLSRYNELEIIFIFRQIVCSLAIMHRHGIAHQDISSDNVLLKEIHLKGFHSRTTISQTEPHSLLSMLLILMDYGQVKAVPYTIDEAGNIQYRKVMINLSTMRPVGKPAFHAPELVRMYSNLKELKKIRGDDCVQYLNECERESFHFDPFAVDIYQLGVTLFIMIFGKLPFSYRGSDLERARDDYLNTLSNGDFFSVVVPTLLREQDAPSVSAECLDFLKHLLTFDPSQRPHIKEVLTHAWLRQNTPTLPSPPILITNNSLLSAIYSPGSHLPPSLPFPVNDRFSYTNNYAFESMEGNPSYDDAVGEA